MSTLPRLAVWRVRSPQAPALLRRCPRCDVARPFDSSGRFRVNANGRRLDVWLIYRCRVCAATFNREVHARTPPEALGPRLQDYLDNDPTVAAEVAARTHGHRVEAAAPATVERDGVGRRIRLSVAPGTRMRLDRVLAEGFAVSRGAVRRAVVEGRLVVPGGVPRLSRPAQDGLHIDLPEGAVPF